MALAATPVVADLKSWRNERERGFEVESEPVGKEREEREKESLPWRSDLAGGRI